MTQRWREMDSNHRSLPRGSRFILRKVNCAGIDGRPKKFGGVPMVRIHLPPAASPLRTCLRFAGQGIEAATTAQHVDIFGHDLAFRKVAVAHDALLARLGLQIGVLCEKLSNLRFDRLGQQRTRAAAQDLCEGIGKGPWLGELDV